MAESKELERSRHHEVEIFRGTRQHEAAESSYKWDNCKKNPGHDKFFSAQDFKDNHLPKVQKHRHRELIRSRIDLTVRLRVNCTSRERPDDDELAQYRGSDNLRTGTGFIWRVAPPEFNEPCFCDECWGEKTEKLWKLVVRTAHHVVFNTEEAKLTKVDLFLDDESCEIQSALGMRVMRRTDPDRDMCYMECVTCDTGLGERIESVWRRYERRKKFLDLSGIDLDFLPSHYKDCDLALIVSHPHGQSKKITWGELGKKEQNYCIKYNVPTCPGSSGAPVFQFLFNKAKYFGLYPFFLPLHSASIEMSPDQEDQLNFGFWKL